jgi:O-antigen/teichoic acid export membrane protein
MSQSYSKSFIKDNSIVITGHILVYMKGIILMPIIIKTVGVTIYGGFVLLTSILGIVFGLSSFGAGFRANRFMPSAADITARRNLFYPQFFFQIISILLLSLLLILLDRQINIYIFKNEINYSVLVIPCYLILYVIYSQGSSYFRYTSRVHYMTAATLCFPYFHIGFILLFFYGYHFININVLVLSQTLSAFLIAAPCFWIIFREIGVKFSFYNLEGLVSDIKLGFPLVLNFIVDFILAGSDRYFIAFYMTVSAVGCYNPGYVLGSLIVFIPKLANSKVAENAYLVTPIVALGTLFYGLNIILSNVLFVRMKTAAMFKMNLLASVFNLLANLILLYFFRNIIVAAITTFLSYFIAFMYINKTIKVDWPVDFQLVVIVKSVLASLFMGGLLFWVTFKLGKVDSVSVLIGEVVLGIVIYFGALLALKTFSAKELAFMKRYAYR